MFRTARYYAGSKRNKHLVVLIMFVAANVIATVNPLLYGWFINKLQLEGTAIIYHAWLYALAYLGLNLLQWSLYGPARIMGRHLAFEVSKNYLCELHHHVIRLPLKWHTNNHSGATISRITKGYEALKNYYQNDWLYVKAICNFLFSVIAMVYFSPLFGSIGVLLGFLAMFVIFKFDAAYFKAMKDTNERENEVSSSLLDSISNIITVVSLRIEKQMENNVLQKVMLVLPAFKRKVKINALKWFLADILITLIYISIVVGYVYQNYQVGQTFLIGGLVTLLVYVNRFTGVFNDMAWLFSMILEQSANVKNAEVIQQAAKQSPFSEHEMPKVKEWKTINLKNINFSYHGNTVNGKNIRNLQSINLTIHSGQRIALIGKSGSGKSTLLALFRGLFGGGYSLDIKIDDKDFGDHLKILADQTTFLPQEPEIFENTILYNLTLGLPFEKEDIDLACKLARIDEEINVLPKGIHSNLKEKGVNLSGGQKQRLALARGLLMMQNSRIVLMDEPTSSVDLKTENTIFDSIFNKLKGKTIIASIHRLHLLEKFDYVYILQEGQLVDEGTPHHLTNHSSIFKEHSAK
ncbi:ABC transporter ATP-binding protein [Fulvivirgaceae bacterium BMA12]|uniref:ABC transporter ATP-binding protein n=1 Tax=Agaribacillus aureus TaxID=3051825 RepID=A0ABT8LDD9_9BACT|nr:ABC transporter ATP-binding protein [Fulvivirgaceae bacterium BMA12]